MDITFAELRNKIVINTPDGRRLGRVVDLSMTTSGQILGLILPSTGAFFRCANLNNCLFVPWHHIQRIGDDTILVDITAPAMLTQ